MHKHGQDPQRLTHTLCGQPLLEVDRWSGLSWCPTDCPQCVQVRDARKDTERFNKEGQASKPKSLFATILDSFRARKSRNDYRNIL